MPALTGPLLRWYTGAARDLPWRRPGTSAWGVLVSEVMLQQTPVGRVVPAYEAWLRRWPSPAGLAAVPPGEAVRAWGRLGYPRRALRLHAAATVITQRHGGAVPATLTELRTLPGVGAYTAAAVAAFAHGQRCAVLDTNVRRVLARLLTGAAAPGPAPTAAERALAESLLPSDAATAARVSVAVMELGALVCTSRAPACERCPVRKDCAWRAAGAPRPTVTRRAQRYQGTDRQARGRLLGVLREAAGPVPRERLDATWPDAVQRARALDGLVADGLVEPRAGGLFGLPG